MGAEPARRGPVELFAGELSGPPAGLNMEVSIWLQTTPATEGMPVFHVSVENTGTGLHETREFRSSESNDVLGSWLRARLEFSLRAGPNRVRFWADGDGITVDELLIRPRALEVFTFSDDGRFHARNNIPFDFEPERRD